MLALREARFAYELAVRRGAVLVRLPARGGAMRELTAAPVFLAVNLAARSLDHVAITLHHRGNLLALVRMDQKHDFVVSQSRLLMG